MSSTIAGWATRGLVAGVLLVLAAGPARAQNRGGARQGCSGQQSGAMAGLAQQRGMLAGLQLRQQANLRGGLAQPRLAALTPLQQQQYALLLAIQQQQQQQLALLLALQQ